MKNRESLKPVEAASLLLSGLLFLAVPIRAEETAGLSECHANGLFSQLTSDRSDLARLGSGRIQWPPASEIESFYALGFSVDGWFAYSNRLEGLRLAEPIGNCRGDLPCFDVSLFNITCSRPCAGDIDPAAGEECRCLQGVTMDDIAALGIRTGESMEFGDFPATFDGVDYDIEMTYRENAILPEVRNKPRRPEFPETRAFLIASARERTLLTRIDHNHSGIGIGMRVAGWLKHPELDHMIVFFLARKISTNSSWPKPYFLLPVAADLLPKAPTRTRLE